VHIIKTTAPIPTKFRRLSQHTHYKPKLADGHHLGKIEKLLYLSRGSTDFDKNWLEDAVRPSWPIRPLKFFEILEIQDGGGGHLEKSKNS